VIDMPELYGKIYTPRVSGNGAVIYIHRSFIGKKVRCRTIGEPVGKNYSGEAQIREIKKKGETGIIYVPKRWLGHKVRVEEI